MDYEVDEKEILYFIRVLKASVDYHPGKNEHWLGISLLTNDDMHKMCSTKFGKDYVVMTNPNQRKLRERIFKALRGEQDG